MGYYYAVCIHFSEDCKKSFDAYINSLSEKDISKLSEKYTDVYFSEYSLEELRNEVFHFLETATTRCKHLEEVVYIWDCVKWYKDYPPVAIIEDFFKKSEYSTFAFARMGENGEDIESMGSYYLGYFQIRKGFICDKSLEYLLNIRNK